MPESGEHVITSSNPPSSRPPPPDDSMGPIQSSFNALFWLFMLVITIRACTEPSVDYSEPSKPATPRSRVATFEAGTAGTPPLSIVLGGGSYVFVYYTVDQLEEARSSHPLGRTFFADFNTGEVQGDLKTADTIFLVGNVKLRVGESRLDDTLYASTVSAGKKISAYFNYATSARGPPVGKRIVVVGEITEIDIGAGAGNARREIDILELDPSEQERSEYTEATRDYEIKLRQYKAQKYGSKPKPHR